MVFLIVGYLIERLKFMGGKWFLIWKMYVENKQSARGSRRGKIFGVEFVVVVKKGQEKYGVLFYLIQCCQSRSNLKAFGETMKIGCAALHVLVNRRRQNRAKRFQTHYP